MYKLSEIFSMPVISLYNGQVEGIVKNAILDKKLRKIKYFFVIGTNDFDEEQIFSVNSIFKIGKDAIIVKNTSCLELYSNFEPQLTSNNPINLNAYTIDGTKLGKIHDVFFDEKYNVQSLQLSNNEIITIDEIASSSSNVLLIHNKDSKINISKFSDQKKPKLIKTEEPVTILRANFNQTNNEKTAQQTILPSKITSTVNFLVGRIVTQNLYSQSKEVIAKKGSQITLKTIDCARKNGKIKELAIFSA